MTDQYKKYLFDILRAIDLIEAFVGPLTDFKEYLKDLKTQSAVERQLGIIGEAVNKFDKNFPESPAKCKKDCWLEKSHYPCL